MMLILIVYIYILIVKNIAMLINKIHDKVLILNYKYYF